MTLVKTRRLLKSCADLSPPRASESDRGVGRAAESARVRGRGARSLPANAQAPRRRTIAKKRRKNRGMCALYAGVPPQGKLGTTKFSRSGCGGWVRGLGTKLTIPYKPFRPDTPTPDPPICGAHVPTR